MFQIDVRGLDEAIRQLETWARLDKHTLMQIAGETASRQLRRRIASEKRAPDGRPRGNASRDERMWSTDP